jgi:hypothetical protein
MGAPAEMLETVRLADVLVWTAAAFGCWLVLILLLQRLRMPEPVARATRCPCRRDGLACTKTRQSPAG